MPPSALAQDKGTVNPKPLPPLANPNDPHIGAKELFGRKVLPAAIAGARARLLRQGLHRGRRGAADQRRQLAGDAAVAQPQLGPSAIWSRCSSGWPSRRSKDAGWPGILVGDMSQPRGGPMLTGHASHQVGLDADIWLTPMPNRQLVAQRARGDVGGDDGARTTGSTSIRRAWTPSHLR